MLKQTKLIYIANVRIPTEKAHGIQIMKMCEAFAVTDIEVELVVPTRINLIKSDPFEYFGVRKNFTITRVCSLDWVRLGKFGFLVQSLSFAIVSFLYALKQQVNIIYSRDELPLFFLSFFKKNLFWETHTAKRGFVVRMVLKKVKGIISITQGLKSFYTKNNNVSAEKILVAPDGVDLEQFSVSATKEECRKKLNLPQDKKIIMYTGHLYDWKGVHILAESAKLLKNEETIVFVGGVEEDINKFKETHGNISNIRILGKKPHSEMPLYLKSADVLVLPNSAESDISRYYTSPLKLFEYMASGVPIVASGLPSICEVLSEKNAILVEPDNTQSLYSGIQKVFENTEFSAKIAKQARGDAGKYSWCGRARIVIRNFG